VTGPLEWSPALSSFCWCGYRSIRSSSIDDGKHRVSWFVWSAASGETALIAVCWLPDCRPTVNGGAKLRVVRPAPDLRRSGIAACFRLRAKSCGGGLVFQASLTSAAVLEVISDAGRRHTHGSRRDQRQHDARYSLPMPRVAQLCILYSISCQWPCRRTSQQRQAMRKLRTLPANMVATIFA